MSRHVTYSFTQWETTSHRLHVTGVFFSLLARLYIYIYYIYKKRRSWKQTSWQLKLERERDIEGTLCRVAWKQDTHPVTHFACIIDSIKMSARPCSSEMSHHPHPHTLQLPRSSRLLLSTSVILAGVLFSCLSNIFANHFCALASFIFTSVFTHVPLPQCPTHNHTYWHSHKPVRIHIYTRTSSFVIYN